METKPEMQKNCISGFLTVKLGFVGAFDASVWGLCPHTPNQRNIIPLDSCINPPKPLYGA